MKHLSLAARYRPQTFAEVAGQDTVKAVLSRAAAEDKVAAAYLLSGTRGVGKTTIARIFAKALNCEHAPGPEPCNQCPQCRKITQGSHVDVAEIDGASNNSVDDARALRETIGYAPMEGRYKVFIIDEAHMLSRNAFNALLKTLEEPPSRVVFIFATTEVHKFPITIVSRCQHFVFRHLSEDALHAHLCDVLDREGLTYEEAAVRLIARRAAGSVRDSMSLLDQALALGGDSLTAGVTREVLGLAGQELFVSLFEALAGRDCAGVAELSRRIAAQGVDIGFFVRELAGHLRTLFLLRQAGTAMLPHLGLTRDEAACWQGLAPRFSATHLHAAWQMTLDAQRGIVQNPEPAAALELLLLNLALLPQLLPLEHLPGAAALPVTDNGASPPPVQPAGMIPAQQTAGVPPAQAARREGGSPLRQTGTGAPRAGRTDAAAPADDEDAESDDPAPAGDLPEPPEALTARPAVVARPAAETASAATGTTVRRQEEAPSAEAATAVPAAGEEGTARPETPPDWAAFCEYCRSEQAEGRPSPPPYLLRQMRAEWTPGGLRLYPSAGQILAQAEKHRADILAALARYGAGTPTLELVPPRPPRSEADLIEEFRQRPEMQDCLSLLNATIKHCTEA